MHRSTFSIRIGRHRCLRRCLCARVLTLAVTVICPSVLAAQSPQQSTADSARLSYVTAEYGYENFRGAIEPWQFASLSAGRRTLRGTAIGRLNYANRFSSDGLQIEADAYPRIARGKYAYLNVGYSQADIFPAWRLAGEIFSTVPGAWEVSLGFRQLRFTSTPVTLYTGSVGKYAGNYWVSLRPYVRFQNSGNSASSGLTARRYFADALHYVGARATYGSAPSERVTMDQLARMKSSSADLHGSTGPWEKTVATWSIGVSREQLTSSLTRRSWTVTAGLIFLLRPER